jgi:isopenicillin-N N-acyltransferase-like protein
MSYAPFPLIEIVGSPHERGVTYGRQARDRILRSIEIYSRALKGLGMGPAGLRDAVARLFPSIEGFAPDLIEEMRGIASGAGVAFEEIVLVNARTELLQLAARAKAPDPDGCTGAVLMAPATADGEVIHGQNWDWRAECVETAIVLRIRREDGPDILTFTEAGGLARSGLNGAGLAITANYLESDRDYREIGVALPLIRRRALECTHLADMIRIVATTGKSASNNMLLSSRAGFAVDLECAPDEAFALYPKGGVLVHANHWRSAVALAKLQEMGLADTPDSLYRDWRVEEILARDHGRLTLEHLRAALRDDLGAPYAVCRPPVPETSGNLGATVAMILMRPGEGTMEVTPMPAQNRRATVYTL